MHLREVVKSRSRETWNGVGGAEKREEGYVPFQGCSSGWLFEVFGQ